MNKQLEKDMYLVSFGILVFCLVAFIFLIGGFSSDLNLTGFAVAGDSSNTVVVKNISREVAEKSILQAKLDIEEMKKDGFSILYVTDQLIEADQVFERASYAEIIRTSDSNDNLTKQAKKALEGLNYEGFSYSEVLIYTTDISNRKEQAYLLVDRTTITESKLEDYVSQGINTSIAQNTIDKAKTSFNEDRYDETEELLEQANIELDQAKANRASLEALTNAGKTFFQRNWWKIIIALVVSSIISYFAWKKYELFSAKERLDWLTNEKDSLENLMKKAQREHFQESKIPKSVYEIRMRKYAERLGEIKAQIPVLKAVIRHKKKTSEKLETESKGKPKEEYGLKIDDGKTNSS